MLIMFIMYYSSKEKDIMDSLCCLNWGAKAIAPAELNRIYVWISLWIWHNFKGDTFLLKSDKAQRFLRLLDGKCAKNNLKFTH